MLPAQTPLAKTAAVPKTRFTGIFVPHGMAPGYWIPEKEVLEAGKLPFIMKPLEPFRQLSTTPRGGTGLGLPLTKAMAEANRATFHLTSAPKEGTLVEITFAADSTAQA